MINLMCMKQYNRISDEELAAYLEGMLSGKDAARVESAMDIETLEVLSVAKKGLDKFPSAKVIQLPSWNNMPINSASPTYSPLAMAGFLGDSNADEIFNEQNDENSEL